MDALESAGAETEARRAERRGALSTAHETEKLLVSATKNTTQSTMDDAKRKAANEFLKMLGKKAKMQAHIPYMPARLVTILESMVDQTWAELCPEFVEMVASPALSNSQSEVFLLNWASEFPPFWAADSCCPQPYTWLRALFLYHQIPADVTKWKVARSPVFWIIEVRTLRGLTLTRHQ